MNPNRPALALASLALVASLLSCGGGGGGGGGDTLAIRFQYLGDSSTYQADLEWATGKAKALVRGPALGTRLDEEPWDECGGVAISTPGGYLLVLVSVEDLGGRLAVSGPCYVRRSDGLPAAGMIRLDGASMAGMDRGLRRAVVLHEILHVLGFGTLWGPAAEHGFELRADADPDPSEYDPVFTGAQAGLAFLSLNGGGAYGGSPVPVENGLGAGSNDLHWRTSVFGNGAELMVPVVNSPAAPVSATTLASLADMGYEVDLAAASAYSIPAAASPAARIAGPSADLSHDALAVVPRVRGL